MLYVSRPDINFDAITDIPVNKRFVKLPIVPYLKLLSATDPSNGVTSTVWEQINRPQMALINAINDPKYRFVTCAYARRLGKTFIVNVIAQLVLLVPGMHVLIMSPNYNLSAISFELQRRLINQFDLEVEKDNLKDKVIELANGSTVRMGSVSTVDSSVGRSYNLIVFDEAALSDKGKDAFEISLRPTLDRPGSKAIFISTPRGKNNWFSEFFERGNSDQYPDWISLKADYTENTRMLESDIREARNTMSRSKFEQEYMANFNVYEGQIFEVDESHIVEFEGCDNAEYIAGLDPGFRDPTAFVVIAYDPTRDCFFIIDEYLESEKKTPEHAVAFTALIDKYKIDAIFIDSAAPQFASDLAYIYDIATINAKKDVLPGIAYVQSLLQTGRLKISPRCKNTLAYFDQYQWDQKEGLQREKPVHTYSHIPDAVRYALYTYTL